MNILAAMSAFDVGALVTAAAIAIYVVIDWPIISDVTDPWPERVGSWELDSLVHVTPDGEELELPLIDGWDEDSILRTLEHIEAL